jgi:hypothetical protein
VLCYRGCVAPHGRGPCVRRRQVFRISQKDEPEMVAGDARPSVKPANPQFSSGKRQHHNSSPAWEGIKHS